MNNLLENFSKPGWNQLGICSFFCAFIILLFVDKVPKSVSEHLLPSLIVFGIGFSFIGYVEGTLYRWTFGDDDKKKEVEKLNKWFFLANFLWFALFIIYLFFRDVL